ncbi:hypothetical protein OROHE_011470 [Orobanche hederae]
MKCRETLWDTQLLTEALRQDAIELLTDHRDSAVAINIVGRVVQVTRKDTDTQTFSSSWVQLPHLNVFALFQRFSRGPTSYIAYRNLSHLGQPQFHAATWQVIGAVGFMNQCLEIPNGVEPQWNSFRASPTDILK